MNYYPHHIGDFNNSTRHLTRVERSLYRDLIELYYDTEQPLTKDVKKLERKVIAVTSEEKEALYYVLGEFFIECDDSYQHLRCDEELLKYRANNSAKARAGKASAESRKNKKASKKQQNLTGVEQVLNTTLTEAQQNPTNQEPITSNQEPLTMYIPFDSFWNIYPKKVDKKPALAKWKTLKVTEEIFTKIKKHLEIAYTQTDKQFIPGPKVYLGNEKWNDEIIPSGPQQQIIQTPVFKPSSFPELED